MRQLLILYFPLSFHSVRAVFIAYILQIASCEHAGDAGIGAKGGFKRFFIVCFEGERRFSEGRAVACEFFGFVRVHIRKIDDGEEVFFLKVVQILGVFDICSRFDRFRKRRKDSQGAHVFFGILCAGSGSAACEGGNQADMGFMLSSISSGEKG